MKTAYLVPGTAETFYCENCQRDLPLIREMREQGADVIVIPIYLPLKNDRESEFNDTDLFFGAVNMFLEHKIPFYKRLPRILRNIFDNQSFLRVVARFSGSVTPSGMENMTLDMLDPAKQDESEEAQRLCGFLRDSGIELLHISNGLIMGLGIYLKRKLGIPLVCTLQDEDTWIDVMPPFFANEAWKRFGTLAREVDGFISVSAHFSKLINEKTGAENMNTSVIPVGLDLGVYPYSPPVRKSNDELTIAFLSHIKEGCGLDALAVTYKRLRHLSEFSRIKLHIAGGYIRSDLPFVNKIKRLLREEIRMGDVLFYTTFDIKGRLELFREADLLSVPMERGEAFGNFIIESLACGVPVVQPNSGAFPELIHSTGGGVIYGIGNENSLFLLLKYLLENPLFRKTLSQNGRKSVEEKYSLKETSDKTVRLYEVIICRNREAICLS